MFKSKYFWIAVVIFVPFIVIWVLEGLVWAVGTLIAVVALFLLIATRSRRRRYYIQDDYDEEIYVERRPRGPSSSKSMRDLYFPKPLRDIHQRGLDDLGRRQMDDLRRTLKRLRK